MFSRRADWQESVNRLTVARRERLSRGHPTLDLTLSNPTKAGIAYPLDELAEAMARGARASYDPQPLGIVPAREAVADQLQCDAADVMITASTSEAYSFLFKLLTDPGDEVLTFVPTYPLLEHLAAMELVSLRVASLEWHRRWEVPDVHPSPRTRALAAVSPNNPTGSFLTRAEMARLAGHQLPILVDEVFRDYSLGEIGPPTLPQDRLTFSMGGLSKCAGLPHYKLGWIRLGGPPKEKSLALEALERIADTFLSVATPVQVALPDLLRIGGRIRAAIHERLRQNLTLLRATLSARPSITLLPVEGGWSAVLRVPAIQSDEDLALALLDDGVILHPGYFYDFPNDGFLVISLLTPPEEMAAGLRSIVQAVGAQPSK